MRDQRTQEARQRAAKRAERTLAAWSDRDEGVPVIRTRRGQEVVLERVEFRTDEVSGVSYLDVSVGGDPEGGDPHFIVVNPPTLIQDPQGEHVAHGERWRVDPLAALAEVVASNGGAQSQKRRHGR